MKTILFLVLFALVAILVQGQQPKDDKKDDKKADKKPDDKKPADDKKQVQVLPVGPPPPIPTGPVLGEWPDNTVSPQPREEWLKLVDLTKVPDVPLTDPQKGPQCELLKNACNFACGKCTRPDTDVMACPEQDQWAITYDDGPTEFTTKLLDYLDSINQKATFFILGFRARNNTEILRRAYRSGHHIASHTWTHSSLTSLSNDQIIGEIKWTEQFIREAIGVTPTYLRAPFGDVDDRVRAIAKQLGYKIIGWNRDTDDWKVGVPGSGVSKATIVANYTNWVKNPPAATVGLAKGKGVISLQHDLYAETVEAAIESINIIKQKYKPMAVAQCLGDKTPYAEKNAVFDPNQPPAPANASLSANNPAATSLVADATKASGAAQSANATPGNKTSGAELARPMALTAVALLLALIMC
ncbi:uncharacterized protein VTP21DRAFT_6936 [Calcarisporiella thermophila]|uniref:uncharacterized protein n=1 Tax=Calcarisporiella thermophila TaxID=911321 RepID=UPI003742BFC1